MLHTRLGIVKQDREPRAFRPVSKDFKHFFGVVAAEPFPAARLLRGGTGVAGISPATTAHV
jgi:hypothetical protein